MGKALSETEAIAMNDLAANASAKKILRTAEILRPASGNMIERVSIAPVQNQKRYGRDKYPVRLKIPSDPCS